MYAIILFALACGKDNTDTGPVDVDDTAPSNETASPDDTGPDDTGPDDTEADDTDTVDPTPRLEGELSLADADATLWGQYAGETAGWAVNGPGDTNGDGLADILIGAPGQQEGGLNAGCVYLVSGADALGDRELSDVGGRILGGPGDYAGVALAYGGGVAGGTAILVGAPAVNTFDPNPEEGAGPGRVYVAEAPAAGETLTPLDVITLYGESDNDRAGFAVAGGVDLDGDGVDDALVGAPQRSGSEGHMGTAYVILGPISGNMSLADSDLVLVGEEYGDQAGSDVTPAGDVNGDGYIDTWISADGDELDRNGKAYLFLGPLVGDETLADADAIIEGENLNDVAASTISPSDVDSDGYSDALFNAYDADNNGEDSGVAYLLLGPISGASSFADADATFLGLSEEIHTGESLALVGDFDGDGYGDALLGAHHHGETSAPDGRGYLFYGPFDTEELLSEVDLELVNANGSDQTGWDVAASGDIDGDGLDDLLISARAATNSAYAQGAVHVVLGQ